MACKLLKMIDYFSFSREFAKSEKSRAAAVSGAGCGAAGRFENRSQATALLSIPL